mmetsp:Transcript_8984/g.22391  ORF Transcript_8984/g.22391 Transcript_8984/m.22391 type:complete len:210 (+) Transcript_8984:357-986(+)
MLGRDPGLRSREKIHIRLRRPRPPRPPLPRPAPPRPPIQPLRHLLRRLLHPRPRQLQHRPPPRPLRQPHHHLHARPLLPRPPQARTRRLHTQLVSQLGVRRPPQLQRRQSHRNLLLLPPILPGVHPRHALRNQARADHDPQRHLVHHGRDEGRLDERASRPRRHRLDQGETETLRPRGAKERPKTLRASEDASRFPRGPAAQKTKHDHR